MIMFYKNIIMGGKENGMPVDGVFLNFDLKKSETHLHLLVLITDQLKVKE